MVKSPQIKAYSLHEFRIELTASEFFLPAGAHAARERLVLRLLYVFRVCLSVCLFVCALSRVQYVKSYVTMQLQYIAAFGGLQAKLQQAKVVVSCLDGENLVGSHKDPVLMAYSC